MPETSANEIWQVDVNGTVYEASFSELPEWIGGGSLQPGDKVRRGNLRWIEARRVPSLIPFFNAKEQGLPMPVVVTTTDAQPAEPVESTTLPSHAAETIPTGVVAQPVREFNANECVMHAGVPAAFLCEGCANGFCRACPNSYGGSVKVCPLCGAMCRSVAEADKRNGRLSAETAPLGFGAQQFFAALAYPFKFKFSLVCGAAIFAAFTLGQSASAIGGVIMAAAALICVMLGNMLWFSVLSNTINNFIQLKFDENFFSGLEDFSIWDDVVHQFFLSIAAYISAFGPFFIVLAIGFYLVTNAVSDQLATYKKDVEKIPGTHVYTGRELTEQSGQVKDVLERIDKKNSERIDLASNRAAAATETAAAGDPPAEVVNAAPVVDDESREQEELWAAATESRKQSLESAVGKTAETRDMERAETIKAFLGLAAPLVVVGFITLVWGLFFFPAACAVAGYTKSFVATINPMVALDTIKRLGFDYAKILAMAFVIFLGSALIGGLFAVILAPFDLPGMGNIPATGLTAMVTFYIYIVFSAILGYALSKNAAKLDLLR